MTAAERIVTNSNLRDVCNELDFLTLRILQLMNDFIQCKLNIEKTVKNGSLDLAKARYIMGNRNVSALQLPTEDGSEVSALATVTTTKDETSNLDNVVYQVNRISPQEKQKSPRSSVKQRTGKEYDDSKDGEENEPLIQEPGSSRSSLQDPIKWFGVLVPQNLRHSQAWFTKAVDLAVQSATIQSELDVTKNRYQYLLKKKSNYIDSMREP